MPFAKLETPNSQYLSIGQSWFKLGDYSKAKEVLDRIVPELQQHPEVLKLREQIGTRTVSHQVDA
ncbi:MAG TPA: tetratricopeptide repeat protein [Verrucomicrobiae bacterium]